MVMCAVSPLSFQKIWAKIPEDKFAMKYNIFSEGPSNNDVDLVIESDEEREVPINTRCTVNYCHSSAQHRKDDNVEYSIRLSPKAKQNDREDNELCHSMMVSGAFKLCDQVRGYIAGVQQYIISKYLNN